MDQSGGDGDEGKVWGLFVLGRCSGVVGERRFMWMKPGASVGDDSSVHVRSSEMFSIIAIQWILCLRLWYR